jgi:hypothetical protein
LAPPDIKIKRFYKKAKKLFDEIKKARIKIIRLAKQRRVVFKQFRDLSDRENQNIFKLKLDEMIDLNP